LEEPEIQNNSDQKHGCNLAQVDHLVITPTKTLGGSAYSILCDEKEKRTGTLFLGKRKE
jgi:hypothetical protein